MNRTVFMLLAFPFCLPAQDPLARIRAVNLERAGALPSFVADERAILYTASGHADPPKWRAGDTYRSEVTVKGAQVTRAHMLRNGKPEAEPTFNVVGGFGIELKPLFSLECPTVIDFDSGAQGGQGIGSAPRRMHALRRSAPMRITCTKEPGPA